MSKKIFLICNAHLDPVWQWEWEEGAAETLSTFRIAARFCEQYDGFVFNHNEALLYRWIEEFEPALFEKIQKLVKAGKWHIMGGWHLQPDCNMPSGEAFVRQIKSGRRYFKEKFDAYPTTAINFDPFGHTRGLVQIMKKSGFDSYLFMRPSNSFIELPAELFRWVGYDGSEILASRQPSYNTSLGQATQKINKIIQSCPDEDIAACLWGVGNHGGGPSERDLEDISALQKEVEKEDVEIIHSTPEEYFDHVKQHYKELPVFAGELNPWAPGCYTSMIRVKQQYRKLENTLWVTERMATAASANGLMLYPQKELEEVEYDLLTVQFHDMLPGSAVQQAEDMVLRMLSHGAEILSRVKARSFFAMAGGQKKPEPDAIPIMIYNPHPFKVEDDFACEMMLWDQNWKDEFSLPQVEQDGKMLPTQCEKENSSLNLDWRKRAVFHATLEPMQMNRFDCRYYTVPVRPAHHADFEDKEYLYLKNDFVTVRISKSTGYMEQYFIDGTDMLDGKPCELVVFNDSCDSWAMKVTSFDEAVGKFKILTPEEGSIFSGVKGIIPSVRCIENGEVRTVMEAVLGYGHSRAVLHYTLSRASKTIGIDIRVQWAEVQKMLKFSIPANMKDAACVGQVAYGEESFPVNGRENCAQRYVIMKNTLLALAVCNDGVYGSCVKNDTLYMTLLRSAAYCAHPIGEREILAQDRFTPHMEQGERIFTFEISGGSTDEIEVATPRRATLLNEKPMALSFYPPERKEKPLPFCEMSGDEIEMPACKKADDGNGYIIRLFNPFNRKSSVTIQLQIFNMSFDAALKPFEIKTYRVSEKKVIEVNLTEEIF